MSWVVRRNKPETGETRKQSYWDVCLFKRQTLFGSVWRFVYSWFRRFLSDCNHLIQNFCFLTKKCNIDIYNYTVPIQSARWVGRVARKDEKGKAKFFFVEKPEGKNILKDTGVDGRTNVGRMLGIMGGFNWIQLTKNRSQWRAVVNRVLYRFHTMRKMSSVPTISFLKGLCPVIGFHVRWAVTASVAQ